MNEEQVVEKIEPDPNVIPLPASVGPRGMIGKLRDKMLIQVGADANDPDSFIHGPADVPLTPALAMAHMSKFANVNDIKHWLARNFPKLVEGKPHLAPRTSVRLTPREQMEQSVSRAREINTARMRSQGDRAAPQEGLSTEDVGALIDAKIQQATAPIAAAVNQIAEALGVGVSLKPPTAVPNTSRPSNGRRGNRR